MQKSPYFRQGQYNTFYGMPLYINWHLTSMCNYKCSYCFYQGDKSIRKERFSTLTQLQAAVKHITNLNRPEYYITLAGGGEPTIHPHFFELIDLLHKSLKEKLKGINLITNGSQNNKFFNTLAHYAQCAPISVLFSIHTDHVKIKNIVECIENYSNIIKLNFNLMQNPAKQAYVNEIHDKLSMLRKKYTFNLNVNLLRNPPDFDTLDSRYAPIDITWRKEANERFENIQGSALECQNTASSPLSFRFITKIHDDEIINKPYGHTRDEGLLNCNGLYCVAGSHLLAINSNGTCRGLRCSLAPLSADRIADNSPYEDENFITYVQCTMQNCGCSTNHVVPKFADKNEAKIFVEIMRQRQKALIRASSKML